MVSTSTVFADSDIALKSGVHSSSMKGVVLCLLLSHFLCLCCSNKESDPEQYALKLKLHAGGVHRCQYSRDGSRVLSCSSMGDVKVKRSVCVCVVVLQEWYVVVMGLKVRGCGMTSVCGEESGPAWRQMCGTTMK